MKEFIFDVMLNGRYVCTLKYRFCPLFPITEENWQSSLKKNAHP